MIKTDIILAGVGGQGILSIAASIGYASIEAGLYLKQSETHGMSQRGGAVVAHLRLADYPVASDLIPIGKADLILSVEPMEALRHLPYLSGKGYVVTSTSPVENILNYPPVEGLLEELGRLPRKVTVDADKIATEAGNVKASNMVMLGAASSLLKIDTDLIRKGIAKVFRNKGNEIIELNFRAFDAGKEFAP